MDILGIKVTPDTVPFSFFQYLMIYIPVVAIGAFVAIRGFIVKHKDTTIIMGKDGSRHKVSKSKTLDFMLIMEALKTQQDIGRIDNLIFEKQKKHAKETIDSLKDNLKALFDSEIVVKDEKLKERPEEIMLNRDHHYFALLADKVCLIAFQHIIQDFEENGLASKAAPESYSNERALSVVSECFDQIKRYFLGIDAITIIEFEALLEAVRYSFSNKIMSTYMNAIELSKKGQEKKQRMRNYMSAKLAEINGISEAQVKTMFTEITSEDINLDL